MMLIAVCDDNPVALSANAKHIENAFKTLKTEVNIVRYLDGTVLLSDAKSRRFDAVFLDIDMPRMNGFTVAEHLRGMVPDTAVIFITNHSEYVFDSFDYRPFNFIVKTDGNLSPGRLGIVAGKLLRHISQSETLTVNDETGRVLTFPLRDIMYIESDGHHISYFIMGRSTPVRRTGSLSAVEADLTGKDFLRVAKSAIVNIGHITDLNRAKHEITSTDGCKHIVGRRYFTATFEAYRNYRRDSI
jgi:DNA-binding LytR/AlgR family response regulator